MTITDIQKSLHLNTIQFKDVLAYIEASYLYSPSAFKNGSQENLITENQGSARVLYFAKLNKLSQAETLALFVEHFESVLNNPSGTDHQNIRQFQIHGWEGVSFESEVLQLK